MSCRLLRAIEAGFLGDALLGTTVSRQWRFFE
jgi:hypothetical protein